MVTIHNIALNLASFGRWTLRDKAAQRRLALRASSAFDCCGHKFDPCMNFDSQHSTRTTRYEARRWLMGGRVQGVGYRAFVFNLAERFALGGVVQNLTGEVLVEAQGKPAVLDAFAVALVSDAPPLARPKIVSCQSIPLRESKIFEILPSDESRPCAGACTPGQFSLRRLPPRDARSERPALSLSVHQLHAMRTALHADHAHALRQAEYHDGGFFVVYRVPCRIRGSAQPAFPCAAAGLSGVRAATEFRCGV